MDEERIRWLNERLPRTRVIGHGLLRDSRGRVLMCQLTYKERWDLPGGVVESHESPRRGTLREVAEELGHEASSARLVAVNWMSPWSGWDDAVTFLFDLGRIDAGTDLILQPREIAAVHWCDLNDVRRQVAPATARLLETVWPELEGPTRYLEDGRFIDR